MYWAIRGHKFAYPGRKDTIKACIYVKELVRFMLWKVEEGVNSNNTNGADVKSAKGVEIYNCCFEPAYTIQHIVEAMKKVTGLTQFVPDIPNWVIMPMARGFAWLDTGTHDSLSEASTFIEVLEKRQGLKVACLEGIAYRQGWIDSDTLRENAQPMLKNDYGKYLLSILEEKEQTLKKNLEY